LTITPHMTAEEKAAAIKLANEADPGPPITSWRYFKFLVTAFLVILNSGDNGFDGTVMSSVNSMETFQEYFGLPGPLAGGTSLVFGMYTLGGVCAFFPNIYLPDKFGRRWAMFLANIIQVTGAIITANARNMGMLLVGRFITGLGTAASATAAKSYLAEVTPNRSRGRYMGIQNSFYYVGQILATGITIPLGLLQNNNSWRIPFGIQCVPGGTNALFILFCWESPRWLYARGRKDEARRVLAEFHTRDGDIRSPLVEIEIAEFEENISLEGGDKRFWDFKCLFKDFGSRYRFGLCALVSIWGQLSGNGLVTYFLPALLGLAGITDTNRQRELNLVNSVTSMIGALTGSAIIDHVGRRKLMLFASCSAMIGMLIVGGLLSPAGEDNSTRATAGISFIFLFMVFFSFGWTPLQGLYPAEVLAYENRAKGLALQGWCTSAASLINTFGMPIALRDIGYINYFIFFAWDVVGVIVIYLFVVETKQLSLEEINEVFDSRNPKARSFELAKDARSRAAEQKQRIDALATGVQSG